ncbi:hypothetical protein [Vibrio harveyi]|uniref:hypothetical protein n=1 Tax=Vibrio harveyi TaxID=669 RepID=UPI003CEA9C7D
MHKKKLISALLMALAVLTGCVATDKQLSYKNENKERVEIIKNSLSSGGLCIGSSERFSSKDMVLVTSNIKKYVDGMWVETVFDGQFLTVMFDYGDVVKFDVTKQGALTKNRRYAFLETRDGDYAVYSLYDQVDMCTIRFKPHEILFSNNEIHALLNNNVIRH